MKTLDLLRIVLQVSHHRCNSNLVEFYLSRCFWTKFVKRVRLIIFQYLLVNSPTHLSCLTWHRSQRFHIVLRYGRCPCDAEIKKKLSKFSNKTLKCMWCIFKLTFEDFLVPCKPQCVHSSVEPWNSIRCFWTKLVNIKELDQ